MKSKILKISAVLLVIMFSVSSLVVLSNIGGNTNSEGNGISKVVDVNTLQGLKNTIEVGPSPTGIIFDPNNNYMYVSDRGSNNVSVINTTTNNVISQINVGSNPCMLAYDPDNGFLYVTDLGVGVSVINTATNAVVKNIGTGSFPEGITFDQNNKYIYVANEATSNISVINTVTNKDFESISVGCYPRDVTVDTNNNLIYTSTNAGVRVFNTTDNNVFVKTIGVGNNPMGIVFDSSNGVVYTSNAGSSSISLINPKTNSVVKTIVAGASPRCISTDPLNGKIYVANEISGNISGINTATNNITESINVGLQPIDLAVNSHDGQIYVTNCKSNSVSILSDLYPVTITESGLPSGTTWEMNVNGSIYKSTSNNMDVQLLNGSYTADINSSASYFATPSKFIFTVDGYGRTFPVVFKNSSNESYIKAVSTVYPINGQVFAGNTFNISYFDMSHESFGMAYDNKAGTLFIPEYSSTGSKGAIYVYNVSREKLVKTIQIPYYDAIYDPATGYVYAISVTGNLSEINPSTFTIVKNVTVTSPEKGFAELQEQGDYIYSFSEGDITQVYASTMSVVNSLQLSDSLSLSPYFSVYNDNVLTTNREYSDLTIVNMTTLQINYVDLPKNYVPLSVVHYYGPEMLIGGEHYSDILYNISGGYLSAGPNISHIAISSAYDPISHTVYISSVPLSLDSLGNITVVNSENGSILSTIPGGLLQFSMTFDSANQVIYTDDAILGTVTEYSVQHYYSVSFKESNLPSGSTWYVNLTNGMKSGAITGSMYTFHLINDSYTYTIATNKKIYHANAGTFTVNGLISSNDISVSFSKELYMVAFTESGLPSGTPWTLVFNGQSYTMTNSSYSFQLTNGSYSYSATSTDYMNISGKVTVNGGFVIQRVKFNLQTYSLIFTETNLPSTSAWYVNITESNGMGYYSGAISGKTYTFLLTNGSYSYSIGTNNKSYHADAGALQVKGTTTTNIVSVSFSKEFYKVTVTESGLSSGTSWTLSFNGQSYTMTNSSYSFQLTNGSYSYSAISMDYRNISGKVTVNGRSVSQPVNFKLQTYSVTFTETGLSSGTTWYINGSMNNHSSSSVMTFHLTNGSYSFIATNLSSYYTSSIHYNIDINGKNVTETVTYDHYAYITGKVSPNNANVTINGKIISLTATGSFNITVTAGSYDLVISEKGYHSYYDNLSVSNGKTENVSFDLKKISSPGLSGAVIDAIVIGAIAAVAVAGAAFMVVIKKK